ncbi:MAG: hypothetical protein ACP5LD_00435, partial [Desulfomonilaceae bacterium]
MTVGGGDSRGEPPFGSEMTGVDWAQRLRGDECGRVGERMGRRRPALMPRASPWAMKKRPAGAGLGLGARPWTCVIPTQVGIQGGMDLRSSRR